MRRTIHFSTPPVLPVAKPVLPRVEQYLGTIGRMIYIRRIIRAMIATDWSRELVRPLFERVRDRHHQITIHAIEELLKKAGL